MKNKGEANNYSDKAPIGYFPSSLRIDWYELEKKEGKLVKKEDQKVSGKVTIDGKSRKVRAPRV